MSYTIAVRALCEFTAKQGDLDLRFTPSPTSLEGIAGHKTVAARRSPGYRAEVSFTTSVQEDTEVGQRNVWREMKCDVRVRVVRTASSGVAPVPSTGCATLIAGALSLLGTLLLLLIR